MASRTASRAKAVRVVDAADKPSTKDKILDAAEELFAERGYYGVSIREITKKAGVELALANYHFGPKEELFRHVIARRSTEHREDMVKYLDRARAASGGVPLTPEVVIHAFCAPLFERMLNGGPGWNHYIHLLAHLANSPQQYDFIQPMNEQYDPVVERFVAALKEGLPACREHNIYYAFSFLQGAVLYALSDTGGIDRLSRGLCRSSDFEAVLERMVPVFAAGFYSLAGRP